MTDKMLDLLEIDKITEYLDSLGHFAKLTGVERGELLLKALGNPEFKFKTIHVAGTNGKGSTCAYLSSIIEKNGHKVGMFTSPHLVDIRERIQINGELISEEDFCRYFNLVERKRTTELAYFDYVFGMAMLYFADNNVDVVVLETGLGGLLDATNSVSNPVASVITAISLEHTAILGDTVKIIAEQKAGIIKPNVPVIFSGINKEAFEVIKNTAKKNGCMYACVDENTFELKQKDFGHIDFFIHNEYYNNDCFKLSTNALYQMENASIALTTWKLLVKQGVLSCNKESDALTREAIEGTKWQGRMEIINNRIVVDGAHNPQGIEEFVKSVNSIFCEHDEDCDHVKQKDAVLLFSVVSDKNYEQMVSILCGCKHFKRICITVTGGVRKLGTEYIYSAFDEFMDKERIVPVEIYDNVKEAIDSVKEDMLFATGSLYLVADIKKYVLGTDSRKDK